MAGYTTNQADLDQAAKNMLDTNSQLDSALKKMSSELEPLRGAWTGLAATAFHQLIEHFENDAKTLNDSLDKIANSVSANAKEYARQEQEQQQQMSQITSMLSGM